VAVLDASQVGEVDAGTRGKLSQCPAVSQPLFLHLASEVRGRVTAVVCSHGNYVVTAVVAFGTVRHLRNTPRHRQGVQTTGTCGGAL
jgi:hypothetical protein